MAIQLDQARLSASEIAGFERDGFVIPSYRIAGQDFADLKYWAERVALDNPTPNDRIRQVFLPRRPGWDEGVEGGENLFRFAIDPGLLDLIEQLIGPDIILIGSFMIAKRAGQGRAVPWHQDGFYLRINVAPVESVTVWIAIDNVDRSNGCVRYVRGTKAMGLLPTRSESSFGDEIEPGTFALEDIADGILLPGQMAIHDGWVVHGSEANHNGGRRLGFSLNFIPARCHYMRQRNSIGQSATENPAQTSTRPIWLVRGENRNDRNDFTVGHDGLEELDRLAEQGRLTQRAQIAS